MMNLIICEGNSDAVFLGYYLSKRYGWSFVERKEGMFNIDGKQEYDIHEKENQKLGILSIGSCSKFPKAIDLINDYLENSQEKFAKLVYMIDRDEHTNDEDLLRIFRKEPHHTINRTWTTFLKNDAFGKTFSFEATVLIIPDQEVGAIESAFLNALKNRNSDDLLVVNRTNEFIDDLATNNGTYLKKNRLKLKAKLSTTLSVMYPLRTFTKVNSLITEVQWHESPEINDLFSIFEDI